MKRESLWQISVSTSLEAEEAVVELLGRVFARPAAVYENAQTGRAEVSVYCPKIADWSALRRAELRAGLKAAQLGGLDIGAGIIRARRVAREDWSESWKRHFQPIDIGGRLLIKPSWIKRRPRKNQAVVVLDPGLSFGTGNHPTTAFCLRELVRYREPSRPQSFLDIGTGSGILAIAAVKLGYRPVLAMDFDPEAVRVAKQNARQNGVARLARFSRQDITRLPLASAGQYDFICANLMANLLVAEKRRIAGRLRAGGKLVLAGILREEFSQVQAAYEDVGLTLVRCRHEKEWRSGTFSACG